MLCNPADRLAWTLTHAIPAQAAPSSASGVNSVAAISVTASAHSTTPYETTVFNDLARIWPGTASAPITAPTPNPVNSNPNPPGPMCSWSRAMTGSSAHNAEAQIVNVRLRMITVRIAIEWRM